MDNLQEQVLCCVVLALAATATATAANSTATATTTAAPITTTAAAVALSKEASLRGPRPAADSDTAESKPGPLRLGWGRQAVVAGNSGGTGGQVDDNDDSEPYAFDYSVRDPSTGDTKSQWESRVNGVVRGMYSLLQPDGSLRSVAYTADNQNGFRATVKVDSPGLPGSPVLPSGGVPTSSVSSSAAASSATLAAATATPSGSLVFQFPPPGSAGAAAAATTVAGGGTRVTTGTGTDSSGSTASSSSSTSRPSQPSALLSQTAPLQGLGGPTASAHQSADDDLSPWTAILGGLSGSSAGATNTGEAGGGGHIALLDFEATTPLLGPQGGQGQPAWPSHEQNSVDDDAVVHPPVRLPLEHEAADGNSAQHFVFDDSNEDAGGGLAQGISQDYGQDQGQDFGHGFTHDFSQDFGEEFGQDFGQGFGSQGPGEDVIRSPGPPGPPGPSGHPGPPRHPGLPRMRLVMRRQRARKRHVKPHSQRHPPPRWLWVMKTKH